MTTSVCVHVCVCLFVCACLYFRSDSALVDLSMVQKQLQSGLYESLAAFHSDMLTVFHCAEVSASCAFLLLHLSCTQKCAILVSTALSGLPLCCRC